MTTADWIAAGFSGYPDVTFLSARRVRLNADYCYTDLKGRRHTAKTGLISDGGTIPRFLWRLIPPYASDYLPGFLLHDQFCKDAEDLYAAGMVHEAKELTS